MEKDLTERLFKMAVRVIKFLRTMPNTYEYSVFKYQLVKAATSSSANYEESQSGSSKADFAYKVEISLREMRESNYWLRLIKATCEDLKNDFEELNYLIKESAELKLILGSIVIKSKKRITRDAEF